MSLLRLDQVSHTVGTFQLRDISLSLEAGDLVFITGSSGSGKSVLLKLCATLFFAPDRGSLRVENQDISQVDYLTLQGLRKHIGVVFQRDSLISNYTVYDNVALPFEYHTSASVTEVMEQVMAHLEQWGLAKYAHCRPAELSTGHRRQVAVARATIMNPRLILYDEPTEGLPRLFRLQVINHIENVLVDHQTGALVTTMDRGLMDRLQSYITRVFYLENGRILFSGSYPEYIEFCETSGIIR